MENKSVPQPSVDSNIPPSNQSFIEALASLSYAADVLSNASKAISSAVESLMLASSGSDCRNLLMHIGQPLSPRSRTEEWLDRDYSLNSRSKLETENTPASSFAQTNKAQQDQVIKTNGMPESPRGSSHMPHSQQQTSSDNQSDVSELKLMEPASALFQAGDQAPHRSDQVGVFTTLSGSQERDSQTNADGVALSPMVDHPLQHPSSPLSQRNGDSSGGHM
ncbi:hypothetical protein FRC09_006790 [Ceratobasidium sp. 395]|nr:hypothetical protein FRC09_006790 [Ceratobasidium sp. 395]